MEVKHTKLQRECKNMERTLNTIFTTSQIEKIKTNDRRQNWTTEDIAKSASIYADCPKGYRMLRENNFPLPAIKTLQRHIENITLSPGMILPVIDRLREATTLKETQKLCVLCFDEMQVEGSFVQVAMLRGNFFDLNEFT